MERVTVKSIHPFSRPREHTGHTEVIEFVPEAVTIDHLDVGEGPEYP